MKRHIATAVCVVVATGFVAAIAYGLDTTGTGSKPSLPAFEFHREPATSPEAAARTLFRGVSTESPKRFVQHLLLGVCDGSVDTLRKFAESLHETKFSHKGKSFTVYGLRELRQHINPKKPVSVVASAPFDTKDKRVAALPLQSISTYYGEAFVCIDAEAEGYDRRMYRTRIVVARVDGGWYAMPRCRSAKSFYEIADEMRLSPAKAK